MQFQADKRGAGRVLIEPEFAEVGDRIIASAPWAGPGDRHQERFLVFTVRDGKIVDMQGCASRRDAERFARRGARQSRSTGHAK